jgi:hypothetical protein
MEPLVQSFTNRLSPSSCCGQIPLLQKGISMLFVIQIQVEAQDVKDAINNVHKGDVISVNPRPQAQPARTGFIGAPTPTITSVQPTPP